MESQEQIEMPRYRCHKIVRALKIEFVGNQSITPVDKKYTRFWMTDAWMEKNKPEAGGYYVVYDDGYASYSPAKAFEDGYTLMP